MIIDTNNLPTFVAAETPVKLKSKTMIYIFILLLVVVAAYFIYRYFKVKSDED